MDSRLQRRVQRYGWDKAAAHYEKYWHRQLAPAHHQLLEMAALQPNERAIEVAAGTGLVTFPAAEAVGTAGSVVATDISDAMVTFLGAEATTRGLSQVSATRADAEELVFPDAGFDVALCALGLMYVPDPLQALREMHRVLRPGGRAVVAVWGARQNCGWAEIFSIVDRRVSSEVCPLFFQLGSGDALLQTMKLAGFGGLVAHRISTKLMYDSEDDACGAAFLGGPVALAYSRFDESTRAGAHAEYLASISAWQADRGYAVPGEFVVAEGRRTN